VARQKGAVRRFLREAKVAARMSSEHAVRVLDVGTIRETGAPYIVMEYLEGIDLLQRLRTEGPMTPPRAVTCILQICEVLAEAHAIGIVHRDLKPANVFLTAGDQVKVLDFGISKLTTEEPERALTGRGSVLGSPGYMAPEQMRSSFDVDARTDIWALGVILYQTLTGRPPFGGPNLPALFSSILLDEPKPFEPHELFVVAEKCLRVSRADRYQDVLELAEALAPFAPGEASRSIARIRTHLRERHCPARRLLRWLPIALAIPIGAALALVFEVPRAKELRRGLHPTVTEARATQK
jgi:serine/threonine-protein kinase